ncbi:MAG TPA: ribonuclease J [Holophagaceae bacterium]|nr:ribonuclease J [Holophagaceae bacterium]
MDFETWMEPPRSGELRLVPIGGVGEFGMNALAVHTREDLLLVDCGQLFPSEDQPGIDRIVPDFAYLEPFADRIRGVALTHGHEDHIGALPYFLHRWPVPVYGTAFTLGLVEGKLKEHGLDLDLLHEVQDFDRVEFGRDLAVEWIPITHSIPDACCLAIHTPQGVVVHSGDFKLDPTPIDGRLTGISRLQELSESGVRLLLSDSTNAFRSGRAPSEASCREGLEDAFEASEGRLIVATFSSNVHRIQLLAELALKHGRKLVGLGRSLERALGLARRLHKMELPEGLLLEASEAADLPASKVLIVCTGSQGEPMSALSRMLRGEMKGLKLGKGDRLILSSRPIPGNEIPIARLLDAAARLGVETDISAFGPIHATGHGHRDDMRVLMRAVRPAHFVPVHGAYRNLQAHARLAREEGWTDRQVTLLDGGECLRITDKEIRIAGTVPVGRLLVDEGVDHAVDVQVVKDRLILQEDGVIFATVQLDGRGGLVAEPTVLSRGFVVRSDDEAYAEVLKGALKAALEAIPADLRKDSEALRDLLRQAIRKAVRKTTGTRPMVVPVILEG